MVVVEVFHEVFLEALTQCIFDESNVLTVVLITKGYSQELLKALGDIVLKQIAIKVDHRDDVIVIWHKRGFRNARQIVR